MALCLGLMAGGLLARPHVLALPLAPEIFKVDQADHGLAARQVGEAALQRGFRRLSCHHRIGDQRSKPNGRHRAKSVGERNFRIAKRING